MNKNRRIAFAGYYGMSNFGDDLFGVAATLGASAHWTNYSTCLVGPRVRGLDTTYVAPWGTPRALYRGFGATGKAARFVVGALAHAGAEKLVYAGGSLFHGDAPSVSSVLETLFSGRTDLSAIGVSVGPFNSIRAEREARSRLARFEYIAVRDRASYDILQEFNLSAKVVLSADLATTLDIDSGALIAKTTGVATIGFSPCHLVGRDANARQLCDAFAEAMRLLQGASSRRHRVFVVCLNTHPIAGDLHLCRYAKTRLDGVGIENMLLQYDKLGVLETCNAIAALDAYVSSRLHGAVVAHVASVPFYLHEYHRKCSDFLDETEKKPSHRLDPVDVSADALTRILFELLVDFQQPRGRSMERPRRGHESFIAAPWATRENLQ